jgi:outer membrane receptor protein involved in Fe transport
MSIRTRLASLVCALSLVTSMVGSMAVAASAQTQAAVSISGSLIDQAGGVAIANATISLFQGDAKVAETKSATDGTFVFSNQAPGVYRIEVRAEGYQGARSDNVALSSGVDVQAFRVALQRATTQSSELKEIGRVSASSGRSSVSTATTISQSVSGDLIQKEGYVRIGDALNMLAGVNVGGLSSSIGDGLSINIRGFGPSETQTLIDGHPVGPFGPGSGGFDYQNSPSFAIGETRVTFGSGALGLYGTDSIGGTVDMQTINPTRAREFSITQGFGNQGLSKTLIQATGTLNDKFGYALVHAVQGTYGPWKPQTAPQPGLLGTDLSSANVAATTQEFAGNYLLRNDLLKLKYDLNDKTQVSASMLSANSWSDKSGNGDNCYFDYNFQQYNAQQIIAGGANTYPGGANPGDPGSITCNGTIAVNTNNGPACITAAQFAAKTSGLAGGGQGPWQAHRMLDFHTRLATLVGNNLISVDGFTNRYTTDYNRSAAGATCDQVSACVALFPGSMKFTGGFNTSFYTTSGILVSDDIATGRNDFGFGYYSQHQIIANEQFNNGGIKGVTATYTIVPTTTFNQTNSNFFVRDDYKASDKTSLYLNGWLKHSSVTSKTTFDPRLSIVYKMSPSDVLRLTGGRSDGEPSPSLTGGPANLNSTPTNITFKCGGVTSVGSVSNAGLQPEQSTDLEVGYGHRFGADSIIQADFYSSNETNRIFGGTLPVSALGFGAIPTPLLSAYNLRYGQFCGGAVPTLANFSVGTNYNAASARFKGVEISGRARANRAFYVDYTYDIQSAVYNDLPDSILKRNVFDINGSQIQGLPLHKGTIGLDYSTHGGIELRLDNIFIGSNNQYNRPAFAYSNASLSQRFGKNTTLNVGVLNAFNSIHSTLYDIGAAPYIAENQFGGDATALDQALNQGTAQTGLLPTQVVVSITRKL